MAFKDGMKAIAGVLKVVAVGLGIGVPALCVWMAISEGSKIGSVIAGFGFGLVLFLVFWTPAWIIKKFIQ
jgi:hypothetical protein